VTVCTPSFAAIRSALYVLAGSLLQAESSIADARNAATARFVSFDPNTLLILR
jgi:hypothetical protein